MEVGLFGFCETTYNCFVKSKAPVTLQGLFSAVIMTEKQTEVGHVSNVKPSTKPLDTEITNKSSRGMYDFKKLNKK